MGMYALRAENGPYFYSCSLDKYGEEFTYDTREAAEEALAAVEKMLQPGLFQVVPCPGEHVKFTE